MLGSAIEPADALKYALALQVLNTKKYFFRVMAVYGFQNCTLVLHPAGRGYSFHPAGHVHVHLLTTLECFWHDVWTSFVSTTNHLESCRKHLNDSNSLSCVHVVIQQRQLHVQKSSLTAIVHCLSDHNAFEVLLDPITAVPRVPVLYPPECPFVSIWKCMHCYRVMTFWRRLL